MYARQAAAVVCLVVLAGCSPAGIAPAGPSETTVVDGEPLVRCGQDDLPFRPSVMAAPNRHPSDDPGIVAALEHLVSEAGMDAPPALQGGHVKGGPWFVLAATGTEANVATGSWTAQGSVPGRDAMNVILSTRSGTWRVTGWGSCGLSPLPPAGTTWAVVFPDGPTDPSATAVQVRVSERECTSGRDPGPFLHEQFVVETDSSVTVYWTSTPMALSGPRPRSLRSQVASPTGLRCFPVSWPWRLETGKHLSPVARRSARGGAGSRPPGRRRARR